MAVILGCVPGMVSTWRNVLRDPWLVSRVRSIFSNSESQKKEMQQDSEMGQNNDDHTLRVRNNDRTLTLETI